MQAFHLNKTQNAPLGVKKPQNLAISRLFSQTEDQKDATKNATKKIEVPVINLALLHLVHPHFSGIRCSRFIERSHHRFFWN